MIRSMIESVSRLLKEDTWSKVVQIAINRLSLFALSQQFGSFFLINHDSHCQSTKLGEIMLKGEEDFIQGCDPSCRRQQLYLSSTLL